MGEPAPTTFDLVLATVDRTDELDAFFRSLAPQTHRQFRVIVVDQNEDDRVSQVLAGHQLEVVHVRSDRGLSRARNVGLSHVDADIVTFPDDDCLYPPDLLESVARRLAEDPGLDGLTGRTVDRAGRSSSSWERDAAILTSDNLWNRANSVTIFLRRELVSAVGGFDGELGLGSGKPWSSGEETDYLVRAIRSNARIAYDPSLTVVHEEPHFSRVDLSVLGYREGASVGYLLRKHGYPARTVARMLVRPLGGAVVALARIDVSRAGFHVSTLRGRIVGFRSRRPD